MRYCLMALILSCLTLFFFSPQALAEEKQTAVAVEQEKPKKKRAKMLTGTPVNTNIAGAGTLPEGKLLTVYNFSLADKTHAKRGYKGSDVFSQVHLLKIRYGLTNHWELNSTGGYINNDRRNPKPANGASHMEGITDQSLGLSYAPLQMHQGDPIALSFSGAVTMPTGFYGENRIPGNGAWGGRAAAGIAGFVTDDIRLDTELVWTMPFERGNQKVRRGDQYQWNTMARYLFDWFDIGIESTYIHNENGDKRTAGGKVNLRNGGTEWHIGPNTSIAIDEFDMWVGAGVYFPVMQDMKGPSVVDDIQYHFKIAKMW